MSIVASTLLSDRQPKTWGVHGIRSMGANNIRPFLAHLNRHELEVEDAALPRRSSLSARWTWDDDAESLALRAQHRDGCVAHSHGCYIACQAQVEFGLQWSVLLLIAPAMERDFDFTAMHDQGTRVICAHSKKDAAIWFGNRLWRSHFGNAGRVGFNDPRVEHHQANGDHDDYFDRGEIERWVRLYKSQYAAYAPSPAGCS